MTASVAVATTGQSAVAHTPTVDELVKDNLPLVGYLVRELVGRLPAHVSRDDLTSAGMLALVTSAQGFDVSRGVPFNRFATIRIRGALTDELRSMDWASRGVRSKARELSTAQQELTSVLGRTPTRSELAEVLGTSVQELNNLAADVHRAATLSVEGLSEATGEDLLPSRTVGPESLLVQREQVGLLRDAIAELPERLRVVIEEYFYGNRRMADIAAELGVTESRISQLRSEALGMLRAGLQGQEGGFETAGSAVAGSAAAGTRVGGAAAARAGSARITTAAKTAKPSRKQAAEQAYIAAIAARSTLAGRLSATTAMGDTLEGTLEGLRAAQ